MPESPLVPPGEGFTPALAVVARSLEKIFRQGEVITPADWAAENLVVPDGPYAGERFNPTLTPYLVQPLNAFSDAEAGVNRIVIRKSAQTGFTLLAIAAIGHSIDREPCRIMLVQPTIQAMVDFNKEKLTPAIEESPTLKARVAPQTSRSARGSTMHVKRYPGGALTLAISTSTADLRGKTVKKVVKDEASEYPEDLDGQGSPHQMIAARYEAFLMTGDYKELSISTPVIKGSCYIDAEFELGDQRYWHVPCPACGAQFVFTFGPQFRFNKEHPHDAHYITPCCGTTINSDQKNGMVRKGEWIATAPGPGKHWSYHFDALSSPFVPWDSIAARFLQSKDDPVKQKAFDNLTLGRAHEIRGDAPDHERLMALRESYDRGRIPPQCLLLTAAADVQANGIYVEIVAYAPDRQSWVVDALVIGGDTDDPEAGAFAKLAKLYETKYPDSFGHMRSIDAFGVDSGFRSNVVYAWCRKRPATFALKGGDGWARQPISTPTLVDVNVAGKKIAQGASVWTVGVWALKAQLYAALRKTRVAEGAAEEPAGCLHFGDWMDSHYFVQLTNEYLVDERFKGRLRRVWKERGPNHFLDCRIYNHALADYLGLNRMTPREWQHLAGLRGVPIGAAFGAQPATSPPPPAAPGVEAAPAPAGPPAGPPPEPKTRLVNKPRPQARRSSYMDGW